MAILNLQRISIGEMEIFPGTVKITTDDELNVILLPGYLNDHYNTISLPDIVTPSDLLWISYKEFGKIQSSFFSIIVMDGVYTLTLASANGSVTGPEGSYENAIALFYGASGSFLKTPDFTPQANTQIGFNSSGAPSLTYFDLNRFIVTDSELSVNTSKLGNLFGPDSISQPMVLPIFASSTSIEEFSYTSNSLIGYTSSSSIVECISAGTDLSLSNAQLTYTGAPLLLPYRAVNVNSTSNTYTLLSTDVNKNLVLYNMTNNVSTILLSDPSDYGAGWVGYLWIYGNEGAIIETVSGLSQIYFQSNTSGQSSYTTPNSPSYKQVTFIKLAVINIPFGPNAGLAFSLNGNLNE